MYDRPLYRRTYRNLCLKNYTHDTDRHECVSVCVKERDKNKCLLPLLLASSHTKEEEAQFTWDGVNDHDPFNIQLIGSLITDNLGLINNLIEDCPVLHIYSIREMTVIKTSSFSVQNDNKLIYRE